MKALYLACVLCCVGCAGEDQQGQSTLTATLNWNAVTTTNLAGYKIYSGTVSGQYGSPVDVGNVTSYVIKNLIFGNTYFFAVTSYNGSGVESAYSNEVSKSIY